MAKTMEVMKEKSEKSKKFVSLKEKLKSIWISGDIALILTSFIFGRALIFYNMSPFVLAYFGASYKKEKFFIPIVFGSLGVLSSGMGVAALKYSLAMLLFVLVMHLWERFILRKSIYISIAVTLSLIISGLFFSALEGLLTYDLIMLFIESSIVFFSVFFIRRSLVLFDKNILGTYVSNEDFLSVVYFASIFMIGFSQFINLGFLNFVDIVCVYACLVFALGQGITITTSVAIISGLIATAGNLTSPAIIGVYALCGFAAGALKRYGKIVVFLGFIATSLMMSMYLSYGGESYIGFYEICISGMLFFLTPRKFVNLLGGIFKKEHEDFEEKGKRTKEYINRKLLSSSEAFHKMSDVFSTVSHRREASVMPKMDDVFETLSHKVCKNCSVCTACWGKDLEGTYKSLVKAFDKLKEKGNIDHLDLPIDFRDRCVRLEEFVECLNHLYELFVLNIKWAQTLSEDRQMVSAQYESVARILSSVADDIGLNINFADSAKQKLLDGLNRMGIRIVGATVVEISQGRFEVNIKTKIEMDAIQTDEIVLLVSEILGKKMALEYGEMAEGLYCLRIIEKSKFTLSTGVAYTTVPEASVSGDSYAGFKLYDGRYALAISDGMGQGKEANKESNDTIKLLEKFLSSGFDNEMALNLINAALVLKTERESCASVDLALINLTSGNGEFIKIGATPTFIRQKDRVKCIHSTSLPAGILKSVDVELTAHKMHDGDLMIMMSDGVIDSVRELVRPEQWVIDFIYENSKITAPQEMAEAILKQAIINCDGNIRDDMTVLVSTLNATKEDKVVNISKKKNKMYKKIKDIVSDKSASF